MAEGTCRFRKMTKAQRIEDVHLVPIGQTGHLSVSSFFLLWLVGRGGNQESGTRDDFVPLRASTLKQEICWLRRRKQKQTHRHENKFLVAKGGERVRVN